MNEWLAELHKIKEQYKHKDSLRDFGKCSERCYEWDDLEYHSKYDKEGNLMPLSFGEDPFFRKIKTPEINTRKNFVKQHTISKDLYDSIVSQYSLGH